MQAGPLAQGRALPANKSVRRLGLLVSASLLAAASACVTVAQAEAAPPVKTAATAEKAPKPVKPVKIAKATLAMLSSKSDADVHAGLDVLRLAGPAAVAAAPEVAAILDRGAHIDLTLATSAFVPLVAALSTLGDLGPSDTAASVTPYAGHRDLPIRRAAVAALGDLHAHGEHALAALRRALGDADDTVRASAARALAMPEAAPLAADLVRAMDHKVGHSGLALGVSCTGDTCIELAARFDSVAPDVDVNAGLDHIIERTDLGDELKMRVLEKVGSVDSTHRQAARVYLASLRSAERWPKGASPALTRARDAALTEASGVR
jgi:hypothetical protein